MKRPAEDAVAQERPGAVEELKRQGTLDMLGRMVVRDGVWVADGERVRAAAGAVEAIGSGRASGLVGEGGGGAGLGEGVGVKGEGREVVGGRKPLKWHMV